jgi:N-acetylmuramate 1-kinase
MTSFDSFLNQALPGRSFEVLPLAGDASNRRYFRIVAGEESMVLMVWEPFVDDGNYPFLSVRDHFEKHGVTVPRVIAKSPSEGLVLLEDLGDLTLERKFWENQGQEIVLPFYEAAVDELIKIHYHATFDKSPCTAFKMEFDVEKLLWEMNYGREHMTKISKVELTAAENKALDDVFNRICSFLHNQKKFIAHRDYHSRNVMLKHGKVRVIDFQDARLGTIQYDMVSLLRDSYVALNDASSDHLIKYYLGKRKELEGKYGLSPLSRDEFDRVYEVQSIQRCFKACGSFSSFYNNRNDTRYLKYIHPTMQTVKRSLEPQREYAAFYQILNDHGLFERKFDDLT